MKKVLLVLIFSLLFYSCSKENVDNNVKKEEKAPLKVEKPAVKNKLTIKFDDLRLNSLQKSNLEQFFNNFYKSINPQNNERIISITGTEKELEAKGDDKPKIERTVFFKDSLNQEELSFDTSKHDDDFKAVMSLFLESVSQNKNIPLINLLGLSFIFEKEKKVEINHSNTRTYLQTSKTYRHEDNKKLSFLLPLYEKIVISKLESMNSDELEAVIDEYSKIKNLNIYQFNNHKHLYWPSHISEVGHKFYKKLKCKPLSYFKFAWKVRLFKEIDNKKFQDYSSISKYALEKLKGKVFYYPSPGDLNNYYRHSDNYFSFLSKNEWKNNDLLISDLKEVVELYIKDPGPSVLSSFANCIRVLLEAKALTKTEIATISDRVKDFREKRYQNSLVKEILKMNYDLGYERVLKIRAAEGYKSLQETWSKRYSLSKTFIPYCTDNAVKLKPELICPILRDYEHIYTTVDILKLYRSAMKSSDPQVKKLASLNFLAHHFRSMQTSWDKYKRTIVEGHEHYHLLPKDSDFDLILESYTHLTETDRFKHSSVVARYLDAQAQCDDSVLKIKFRNFNRIGADSSSFKTVFNNFPLMAHDFLYAVSNRAWVLSGLRSSQSKSIFKYYKDEIKQLLGSFTDKRISYGLNYALKQAENYTFQKHDLINFIELAHAALEDGDNDKFLKIEKFLLAQSLKLRYFNIDFDKVMPGKALQFKDKSYSTIILQKDMKSKLYPKVYYRLIFQEGSPEKVPVQLNGKLSKIKVIKGKGIFIDLLM